MKKPNIVAAAPHASPGGRERLRRQIDFFDNVERPRGYAVGTFVMFI